MRNLLHKIVRILDGTPAVYGKRQSGQSLVELALITPILIVLIMGLVEIGWFANNYLILLEVTRVGARSGTVLSGDLSPLNWNNNASIHYLIQTPDAGNPAPYTYRDCGNVDNNPGFFNFITCLMQRSMDPLQLDICSPSDWPDADKCKDDIVVSVFAIAAIDRGMANLTTPPPNAQPGVNAVVVGRWPSNANECNFNTSNAVSSSERDPFDYSTNQNDDELSKGNHLFWYDDNNTGPERQRGFVYTGQHRLSNNHYCYGSEWSIADVERLFNLPDFNLTGSAQRSKLPNQGMVLAEVFWQHSLLLQNPVFNPVFNMLGSRTMVYVWAAFPVPAAEPHINMDADDNPNTP